MDPRIIGIYRAVGGAVQSAGGRGYSMERIHRVDPVTGVRITQLTSYPVLSHTLYFHCPSVTPDSKTLVFLTYNRGGRLTSPDAWRVNLDGTDLRPVTNREWLGGFVLSPDGKTLYAMERTSLLAWSIDGGEPREIGRLDIDGIPGTILGGITHDNAYYISTVLLPDNRSSIVRFATDGSEARVLVTLPAIPHLMVDTWSGSDRILYGGPEDKDGYTLYLSDRDGENPRPMKLKYHTGHYVWHGNTGKLLATTWNPFGSIGLRGEDDAETQIVARGGHFWHCSGSLDGEWIVSDTNWPDLGLMLINVRTGNWAPLCHPQSGEGHPQWTHPHPFFSPDARYVVFNSDRTGVGQVYVVEIPEALRKQLAGS